MTREGQKMTGGEGRRQEEGRKGEKGKARGGKISPHGHF